MTTTQNTTPSTDSTGTLGQATRITASASTQPHVGSDRHTMAALSAHTLLWCWIVVQSWAQDAVRAAVARASVPAGEGERGEALSTAAITVGLVIIAGAILLALKAKSTTIVSNVCTNADPSSC